MAGPVRGKPGRAGVKLPSKPNPGIARGDHVYAQHPRHGALALKVLATGKHGFTGEADGGARHGLEYGAFLGHKAKVLQRYAVVDQGVDGALLEDDAGRRRFVRGEVPTAPDPDGQPASGTGNPGKVDGGAEAGQPPGSGPSEPAREPATTPATTDDPLTGGLDRLLSKAGAMSLIASTRLLLLKALPSKPGAPRATSRSGKEPAPKDGKGAPESNKGSPGLTYKSTPDAGGTPPEAEDVGAGKPAGPVNMTHGDEVSFTHGKVRGRGKIVASGPDGVTVHDGTREHQVRHDALEGPVAPETPVIPDSVRAALWEKLQAGDTTEDGKPSPLLLAAKQASEAGQVKDRAAFDLFVTAFHAALAAAKAEAPANEPGTSRPGAGMAKALVLLKAQGGAAPRPFDGQAAKPLYVSRAVTNGAAIADHYRQQGCGPLVDPSDMHVTQCYSKAACDWSAMGEGPAKLTVPASAEDRRTEPLGDKGATVLHFASPDLQDRHQAMRKAGASHDFDAYRTHVTVSYDGRGFDKAKPWTGPIELGPESFKEIERDWKPTLTKALAAPLLLLKAVIPGGAHGDLFAQHVQVGPHIQDGKLVPGYSAVRHKAPVTASPVPVSPTPAAAPPAPATPAPKPAASPPVRTKTEAHHARNLDTIGKLKAAGHRVEGHVFATGAGKYRVGLRMWHKFSKPSSIQDTSQTLHLVFPTAKAAHAYLARYVTDVFGAAPAASPSPTALPPAPTPAPASPPAPVDLAPLYAGYLAADELDNGDTYEATDTANRAYDKLVSAAAAQGVSEDDVRAHLEKLCAPPPKAPSAAPGDLLLAPQDVYEAAVYAAANAKFDAGQSVGFATSARRVLLNANVRAHLRLHEGKLQAFEGTRGGRHLWVDMAAGDQAIATLAASLGLPTPWDRLAATAEARTPEDDARDHAKRVADAVALLPYADALEVAREADAAANYSRETGIEFHKVREELVRAAKERGVTGFQFDELYRDMDRLVAEASAATA